MQHKRGRPSSRRKAPRHVQRTHAESHTVKDLYLHGITGMIGLGILVLPIFVMLFYGAFSVYLVILAGSLALLIATLLYDVSLTHDRDPYNFLKDTSGKEYSFIFGFLLVISFLITTIAVGIASVEGMSAFFGLNIYMAIAIVDAVFVLIWAMLFYNKTKSTLNAIGALKLFFILLLIVVGALSIYKSGVNPLSSAELLGSPLFATYATAVLLFIWMYGGFESVAIVYKGESRATAARALIYVLFSIIIIFSIVQLLAYLLGGTAAGIDFSNISNIFTANLLSSQLGSAALDVMMGLSIIVILTVGFAVVNAANHTIENMAKDGVMPRVLEGRTGLKLLITAGVPLILTTVFAYAIAGSPSSSLAYLSVVLLSALVFTAAFVFFAIGYAWHYIRRRDPKRVVFGGVLAFILLALILLIPAPILIGLLIILLIALAGYLMLR